MAKYPFYELAARRTEADGSVRRCFRASDDAERALFVWQRDGAPVLHAQLLLGDEAFVEWHAARVTCGLTNRALGDATDHRHKGVRTFAVNQDETLLARARLLLQGSDLPAVVVDVLLARLQVTDVTSPRHERRETR